MKYVIFFFNLTHAIESRQEERIVRVVGFEKRCKSFNKTIVLKLSVFLY